MLKGLASFIVSSRVAAFGTLLVLCLLALMLPLAALFSSTAIMLVVLYAGSRQALYLAIACTLAMTVFSGFATASPLLGIAMGIAQLLPGLVLASLYKRSGSLSVALQTAVVIALAIFIGVIRLLPDIEQIWAQLLEQLLTAMQANASLPAAEMETVVARLAQFMTGLVIASALLMHSIALLFAHWLHALVRSNDEAEIEHGEISLSKVLAVATILISAAALATQSVFLAQLSGIIGILFFLQGMNAIHSITRAMTKGKLWLILSYLLVIFIPQTMLLLVLFGLIDSLSNLRSRISH
ncbi:MAG: DUF2232 domain-containing protein [Gammaproteobacteria bacterium]|jgi:hypothetical protein|nr:DUF2232 domain-containing protein [Gammaproteobacteria bacterium]|tara:strand:- start:10376 stop:11266 length:891 start_codon:yes stop_codon:yes gene_type:complete